MSGLRGWRMDFSSQLDTYLAGERKVNLDPPGFDASLAKDTTLSTFHGKREDPAAEAKLFNKKQEALWERAQAPIKQVAMMCFMIYMFCGSIQIFSLFFLVTGITTPITAILKSADVFPLDEASPALDRLMPRIMYCVVQFGQLLFVAWRLNAIGLLPTHPSDWLSTLPVPKPFEQSFAAL